MLLLQLTDDTKVGFGIVSLSCAAHPTPIYDNYIYGWAAHDNDTIQNSTIRASVCKICSHKGGKRRKISVKTYIFLVFALGLQLASPWQAHSKCYRSACHLFLKLPDGGIHTFYYLAMPFLLSYGEPVAYCLGRALGIVRKKQRYFVSPNARNKYSWGIWQPSGLSAPRLEKNFPALDCRPHADAKDWNLILCLFIVAQN
jgi:hypothetical protein